MVTHWSQMTVVELRQELRQRGLPTAGKKADLVQRLADAEEAATDDKTSEAIPDADASFPPGPQSNDIVKDLGEDVNTAASPMPQVEDQPTELIGQLPQDKDSGRVVRESVDLQPTPAEPQSFPEVDHDMTEAPALAPAEPPAAQPSVPLPEAETVLTPDTDTGRVSAAIITQTDTALQSEPVIEVVKDALSRKRRSRSPPPEELSSAKRARQDSPDDTRRDLSHPDDSVIRLTDDPRDEHASFAMVQPEVSGLGSGRPSGQCSGDPAENDQDSTKVAAPSSGRQHGGPSRPRRDFAEAFRSAQSNPRDEYKATVVDEPTEEHIRDIEPSQHPATAALYIKNFMRPLREPLLRDYLVELAAPPGTAPDPDAIVDFFLDTIRTHAFVRFATVAAASRVRVCLHGKVWPDERTRKELWVDFIPDKKTREWAEMERSESEKKGSRTRWEVRYETAHDGSISAELVSVDPELAGRGSGPNNPKPLRPAVMDTFVPPSRSIPNGPMRSAGGVEGAPLGPRGRGARRQLANMGMIQTTRAYPPLSFCLVPKETAERRLENMRSYYTKDRHRHMGPPEDINRYTFEQGDVFVDRGREVFIGIRPPGREAERRRARPQFGSSSLANVNGYQPPPGAQRRRFRGGGRARIDDFRDRRRGDWPRARIDRDRDWDRDRGRDWDRDRDRSRSRSRDWRRDRDRDRDRSWDRDRDRDRAWDRRDDRRRY